MKRTFVESPYFSSLLESIDDKSLLSRIQKEILERPENAKVVEGTGGLKKIRVAKQRAGKSGGYRVFYLDLPKKGNTHLIFLLKKNESENITDAEKKEIRALVKQIKRT